MFTVHIQEENCIGCAKCLPVCPVDAIVGANGMLHGVIEEFCIGCKLCIPVCPVQCIDFTTTKAEHQPQIAKARSLAQKNRLLKEQEGKALADKNAVLGNMQSVIQEAINRAKQKA